jgi:hypothetical protein
MALSDEEKEPYLRLALAAFEGGSLDADEYMRRVQAIERAASVAEMARAVEKQGTPATLGQQGTPGTAPGLWQQDTPAASDPHRPSYDPVDLALMMKQASTASRSLKANRYTVLIVLVLLVLILLGLGIWLAARVHTGNSNQSGLGPYRPSPAYISVSASSPLSPRR